MSTCLLNFFFLKEHRILSQLSALRTRQQNEVAERRNRTLLDMGKVNNEFFHNTFILLGICPRDNSLHSKYGAIQVNTKDTHGNVKLDAKLELC